MENNQEEELIQIGQTPIEGTPGVLQSKNAAPDPMSKRQQKKRARDEKWEQYKDKLKEEKKLKRQEKKKKWREQLEAQKKMQAENEESGKLVEEEEKKAGDSKEGAEKVNFKKTTQEKKKKYKEMVAVGQGIIIDCSFQDVMTRKELNSLCSQLAYCQATNKDFPIPSKLTISSFRNRIQEKLTKLGALNWGIVLLEKHYTEYFSTDDLVYLTGDAEEEIEELDPKKTYIIGGLVDRNRFKKGTYNQAVREGIPTRRLPIGKYMKLASSTILAVNHVFSILVRLINGQPIAQALKDSIPQRKVEEYLKQGEAGEEDDGDDNDGDEKGDEPEAKTEIKKPEENTGVQQPETQETQANGDKP